MIHGRGTGAIRKAVRDELARHPLVCRRSRTRPTARRSSSSADDGDPAGLRRVDARGVHTRADAVCTRSHAPRLRARARRSRAAAATTTVGHGRASRRQRRRRPAARPATRRTASRSSPAAGCGGCHTFAAAGSNGAVGPNLDDLSPSFDTVVAQVTNGGGAMPAFKDELSEQEIRDVAAFVSGS